MSYRCKVCGCCVRHGATQRRHVIYKPGLPVQIAREVPVCGSCHAALADGKASLAELVRRHRKPQDAAEAAAVPTAPQALFNQPVKLNSTIKGA